MDNTVRLRFICLGDVIDKKESCHIPRVGDQVTLASGKYNSGLRVDTVEFDFTEKEVNIYVS